MYQLLNNLNRFAKLKNIKFSIVYPIADLKFKVKIRDNLKFIISTRFL